MTLLTPLGQFNQMLHARYVQTVEEITQLAASRASLQPSGAILSYLEEAMKTVSLLNTVVRESKSLPLDQIVSQVVDNYMASKENAVLEGFIQDLVNMFGIVLRAEDNLFHKAAGLNNMFPLLGVRARELSEEALIQYHEALARRDVLSEKRYAQQIFQLFNYLHNLYTPRCEEDLLFIDSCGKVAQDFIDRHSSLTQMEQDSLQVGLRQSLLDRLKQAQGPLEQGIEELEILYAKKHSLSGSLSEEELQLISDQIACCQTQILEHVTRVLSEITTCIRGIPLANVEEFLVVAEPLRECQVLCNLICKMMLCTDAERAEKFVLSSKTFTDVLPFLGASDLEAHIHAQCIYPLLVNQLNQKAACLEAFGALVGIPDAVSVEDSETLRAKLLVEAQEAAQAIVETAVAVVQGFQLLLLLGALSQGDSPQQIRSQLSIGLRQVVEMLSDSSNPSDQQLFMGAMTAAEAISHQDIVMQPLRQDEMSSLQSLYEFAKDAWFLEQEREAQQTFIQMQLEGSNAMIKGVHQPSKQDLLKRLEAVRDKYLVSNDARAQDLAAQFAQL